MADKRITELAELAGANLVPGDQFVVVDVSDTSMAASGTDKRVSHASVVGVRMRAPRFISGAWYGLLGRSETAGGSIDINQFRASPFYVPVTATFDRIGINVFGAADAGVVARLGIYSDNGTGPHSLVVDAGTVAMDSTGRKEATISQELTPGIYWLGAASQNAGSNRGNMSRVADPMGTNGWAMYQGYNSNFALPPYAFFRTSVSGALPATLTPVRADFEITSDPPYVWLRAA